MTITETILNAATKELENAPDGLRFSELVQRLTKTLQGVNENTLWTQVGQLHVSRPSEILKPARGLFILAKFHQVSEKPPPEKPEVGAVRVQEKEFYKPFAEWLVNELEECTRAIELGGNRLKDKWGTPDVIGLRASRQSDIIKFETEIVSAEIKVDTCSLITAFGQACAYRLFSHKSYIVVPLASSQEDVARLDTLCRIFGIGLILFDADRPANPEFQIRVRAAKHEPDMFYANQCLKLIEDDLFR